MNRRNFAGAMDGREWNQTGSLRVSCLHTLTCRLSSIPSHLTIKFIHAHANYSERIPWNIISRKTRRILFIICRRMEMSSSLRENLSRFAGSCQGLGFISEQILKERRVFKVQFNYLMGKLSNVICDKENVTTPRKMSCLRLFYVHPVALINWTS